MAQSPNTGDRPHKRTQAHDGVVVHVHVNTGSTAEQVITRHVDDLEHPLVVAVSQDDREFAAAARRRSYELAVARGHIVRT